MKALLTFFRKTVLKHGWLKLMSLVLAYALWLTIRGSEGERIFLIPVTVQTPPDLQIVGDRPASVEVTVEGAFLSGNFDEMSYNIDLRSYGEGEHSLALTPEGVRLRPASGFKVIQVSPARIKLRLERLVSREVPVKISIRGTPATGYEVYEVHYAPKAITLSGPRSRVDPILEIAAGPVSVAGKSESFDSTLDLQVPDDAVAGSNDTIRASIVLGPRRETVTLRIPVTVRDHGEFVSQPAFVSVSVLAPAQSGRRLTADDITATVSVPEESLASDAIHARPEVRLALQSDEPLKITGVNPAEVTLLRKSRKW